MIVYHLDKWKYKDVWPPEGTLYTEGRWNREGQWLIYCSPTIALAKLEVLANEMHLPIERVCMTIEIPDNPSIFEVNQKVLPKNWMIRPYPLALAKLADKFFQSGALVMKVPSAQSYRENNFTINVRHPDFRSEVKLLSVQPEPFDERLK